MDPLVFFLLAERHALTVREAEALSHAEARWLLALPRTR